jgi:hypothetical protein
MTQSDDVLVYYVVRLDEQPAQDQFSPPEVVRYDLAKFFSQGDAEAYARGVRGKTIIDPRREPRHLQHEAHRGLG